MRFIYIIPFCALMFFGTYAENPIVGFALSEKKAVDENGVPVKQHHNLKHEVQALKERVDQLGKTSNPTYGWIDIDYLCWKGTGTEWNYAMGYPSANVSQIIRGEPKWSSGGRVELGISNLYNWTIAAIGTYFHNNSSAKSYGGSSLETTESFTTVSTINSYSKLQYGTADLEIACNYDLNKTFTVKPIFGARGAWIKNRYIFDTVGTIESAPSQQILEQNHKFCGGGPRLGLKGIAKFGDSGVNFFGLFSASLVYGKVKAEQPQTTIVNSPLSGSTNLVQYYNDLKASIQLVVGGEWKYLFDHDTKAFALHVAWETNYWWFQKDAYDFFMIPGNSKPEYLNSFESIVLHGINVGIGFDF